MKLTFNSFSISTLIGGAFLGFTAHKHCRRGLTLGVGLIGQTRVYFIVPTKPLAHRPFRQQTAERLEVSPEVILYGLAEESSFLSQVL